jgi:hypothetical protein
VQDYNQNSLTENFSGDFAVARKKKSGRLDGRWFIFLILSFVIVVSMILAYFPGLLTAK